MVARPQSGEEKEGGEGQDGLLGESVPTKEDRERGMVPGTRGCVVSRMCACVCVCVCMCACATCALPVAVSISLVVRSSPL